MKAYTYSMVWLCTTHKLLTSTWLSIASWTVVLSWGWVRIFGPFLHTVYILIPYFVWAPFIPVSYNMFRSLPSYIFVSPILLWTIPFYFPDYVKVPSLLLFLFPYYVWNRSFLFPITCLGPFLPTFSYPLFCYEQFHSISLIMLRSRHYYFFFSPIMFGTVHSCFL